MGDHDETDTLDHTKSSRPLSEEIPNPLGPLTPDSVYDFYVNELFPALLSSFPILMHRLWKDALSAGIMAGNEFLLFIQPKWMKQQLEGEGKLQLLLIGDDDDEDGDLSWSPNQLAQQLWEHAVESSKNVNATIADFMIHHFDKDDDGHISPNELLNMTELLSKLPAMKLNQQQPKIESFWAWFSREWPLMDWKIGVFLWQTFGGILLVIAVLSVMPGRLHTWSGKVLRWPILGLTYLLINIELVVYIAIRLVIRIIETLVANPKHRALRNKMARESNSYKEWYQYAAELDKSQKRNIWQSSTTDETSYQYNWQLIKELLKDMKEARLVKKDPILALAVLQQCTRKNVGGIMNEDLFTKTYTGEPKFIVMEFINEVTKTLQWVTDQTLLLEEEETERQNSISYEANFQQKTMMERKKLWGSLVAFATLDFSNSSNNQKTQESKIRESTKDTSRNSSRSRPLSPASHGTSETRSSVSSTSSSSSSIPPVTRQQLLRFLKRARHAYGKTALCLSGGSMMGLYHLGHLKGLMETDCLPDIVSGCSAGSVIGAVLCTRTNDELHRDLDPEVIGPRLHCFDRSWPDRLRSVWENGNLFDGEHWLKMIRWFAGGDMTFEEAYQKTGRVLCIALSATAKKTPPILLNYISAPNVIISSAVVASAAVPGFVKPQQLQCKDPDGTVRSAGPETYYDGSIRHDIPTEGLSEMLNCHFFVACQCNPHIVPFFFNAKGGVGQPSRWSGGEQETSWRGGFLLAALEMYLKNDMRAKFVFLRDLDAAVSFTGTMMTQSFVGTTTIVPQVELKDFFNLFRDPTVSRLYHYLRVGSVAAYQHAAMIRCHYRIADALEECIERLGGGKTGSGIEPKTLGQESPLKKTKASRRASFDVADMGTNGDRFVATNGRRTIWDARQHVAGVPEIISSDHGGANFCSCSNNNSNKHTKVGDGDSVSTSSETFVPNI